MSITSKSKVAAMAAAVTKTILGAQVAKPQLVQMPKAVHEIHVSPTDVIPTGTLITDEIAELAGFEDDTVDALVRSGAVILVDVLASAIVDAPAI